MRAMCWTFVALALASTVVYSSSCSQVLAQVQSPNAASLEDASGLQVIAVREQTQPRGIGLVFSDQSAETLKKFSNRAAGHDVDLFLNGKRIATLKLREPILGNSIVLTGKFSSHFKKSLQGPKVNIVDIKLHR